jgi:hypothetical protein
VEEVRPEGCQEQPPSKVYAAMYIYMAILSS